MRPCLIFHASPPPLIPFITHLLLHTCPHYRVLSGQCYHSLKLVAFHGGRSYSNQIVSSSVIGVGSVLYILIFRMTASLVLGME